MKKRTLNRLNDYFFKRLMGDDKRSDLTLRFLNLILNRTEENEFRKIEFLNPEYNPLTKDVDILPMPKGRGFLDTNDTCLLK
ncbi:PD-(D/E)XK nuclease family transposase [Megamonas funiformis]|uniref:PD-(D/E)XK nuclease family transposase n=1 Tax=Megamonas funiformis TaxID=437897 RepID=UPI003F98232C